jgi:cytochrome P450 / NADPH-cytochrome P450 reductase
MPFESLLSLEEFLSLSLLFVHRYLVSSSPLADPGVCTIAYGVAHTPAQTNPNVPPRPPRRRPHVVSVRPSAKTTFRLRIDAGKTLILMFCAGTALAPFRGFLQQRAIQMRVDWKLVRAVLFVGCRLETKDRLHAEQIDK